MLPPSVRKQEFLCPVDYWRPSDTVRYNRTLCGVGASAPSREPPRAVSVVENALKVLKICTEAEGRSLKQLIVPRSASYNDEAFLLGPRRVAFCVEE